jgi:hypothetical protein
VYDAGDSRMYEGIFINWNLPLAAANRWINISAHLASVEKVTLMTSSCKVPYYLQVPDRDMGTGT